MTKLLSIGTLLIAGASVAVGSLEFMVDHRNFADNLVAELYQSENECTSTLGISMAFSLIYPAGDELNQNQMQSVLGYPVSETTQQLVWDSTQQRLDSKYEGRCLQPSSEEGVKCEEEEASLEIANRIWMADSLIVQDEYRTLLGQNLFQMDFESGDAGSVINAWVNASTNGLVDSVVDNGPLPNVVLIAVNAIYLKASWQTQFKKDFTNVDSFYDSPSRLNSLPSKVNFMHNVGEFLYSDTAVSGYQVLALPFVGTISMIIALPSSEKPSLIKFQEIHESLDDLETARVALAIPKFKFESIYKENLLEALQHIGLTAPFDGGLCFGGEGGCNDRVSDIIHKTVIDVNEEGVEAAAVTALVLDRGMPLDNIPVLFLANHPFQFFIYESQEDVVLFEGYVSDPGSTYTAETSALNAQHGDADFWKESFNVDPREHNTSSSSCWTWALSSVVTLVALAMTV